ncbi:MAG: hypothetical protein LBE46_00630 [Wolbachia pipientis]|nr:hypothetical protein [Wolbachia pipientis]
MEEIRLYKSKEVEQQNRKVSLQAQKQQKVFEVRSHAEITEEISHSPDRKEKYDLRIRIVDNEGIRVKNTAETLRVLNRLISHRTHGCTYEGTKQNLDEYNNKYNLEIKMKDLNQQGYNNKISIENLDNIFHHHVAKHLYVVFDLKPLEARVLAPRQRGEENTIEVYPSSTGEEVKRYSVQEGNEYRELQFNAAKGYNNRTIFRSKMTSEEIKEALCRKIVSHIIICLIPFQSIKMEPNPRDDAQTGMEKVLYSFVDLVQKDYQNVGSKDKDGLEVDLDDN